MNKLKLKIKDMWGGQGQSGGRWDLFFLNQPFPLCCSPTGTPSQLPEPGL